jgi:hypothetical protein
MKIQLSAVLFAIVASGGCVAGVGYHAAIVAPAPVVTVGVAADPGYVAPEMVEVQPGVQVVYDYDEPVFYSDSFYWRYYNNTWYRSNVHNGGWVVYNDVPYGVRSIQRPTEYAHYRPAGYVPHQPNNVRRTEPVRNEPVVRDHRTEPVRTEPVRTEPVVRDHREEVHQEPVHNEPVVRDHRTEEVHQEPAHTEPVVRDHRTEQAPPPAHTEPVVRDHRTNTPPPPPPAKKPVVRDHRS